jgi:hypothetical protein
LVGIVTLSSSKEPIKSESRIQWAEVVPVEANHRERDWESRARGKLAFRLLSRMDCPSLCEDLKNTINIGTPVAIIDLRVFTPEVIPVLGAFAHPSFCDHLNHINFKDKLLGHSHGNQIPKNIRPAGPMLEKILNILVMSEIECLKRLNEYTRSEIAKQICLQKQVRMLYGTQLDAFLAGLSGAIHCTQGPPGTGKVTLMMIVILPLISYSNCNIRVSSELHLCWL